MKRATVIALDWYAYLEQHRQSLDADSLRRLTTNPLRVLDSKNPQMQRIIEGAPLLLDDLDEESARHFEAVQAGLRSAGVTFRLNARLVRGLDYYNRTVFEWTTTQARRAGHRLRGWALRWIDRADWR